MYWLLLWRLLQLLLLRRRFELKLIYVLSALLEEVHQVGFVLIENLAFIIYSLQFERRILLLLQLKLLLLLSLGSLLAKTG